MRGGPGAARAAAALAPVTLALYFVSRLPLACDPDLYHMLCVGREVVTHGAVPLVDRLAYTPTRVPVVHHEWLTGTALYLVVRAAGPAGLAAVKYGLALATAAAGLLLARRQGAGLAVLCFLGLLGLNLAAPGMTSVRAQVVTLLFTAITLHLLESDRRGKRWWIPVYLALHLLWLNCHAGFVVGMGLVGLHALEQSSGRRPWLHLVAVLALAAMLIPVNPVGVAYPRYLFWEGLWLDRSLISEWQPLWTAGASTLAVWIVSVVVEAYALLKVGRRRAPGWVLVVVTALLALRHQRHLPIYGVVWLAQALPVAQRTPFGALLERLWGARPLLTAAVLTAVSAWLLVRVGGARPWKLQLPVTPHEEGGVFYPLGVVAYLDAERFAGNVVVPFELGAYLSWKLDGRVKVSIDGRYEVAFDPSLLREHVRFYTGETAAIDLPERYGSDAVLVPHGWPVAAALSASGRWRQVYVDDAFELFARPGLALPRLERHGDVQVGACP
jgi:hypothetical protein